jgi:hypothetical protein
MTVTDIVTVRRQQKADLLRASHARLVAELSVFRGRSDHRRARVLRKAIAEVRATAEAEGVALDPEPVPTARGRLAAERVRRVWSLLAEGRRQKDVAVEVGLPAEAVSRIARRRSYRDVTEGLEPLPEQGRWRHAERGIGRVIGKTSWG